MKVDVEATKFLNNRRDIIMSRPNSELVFDQDNKLYLKDENGELLSQKELIEIIEIKDALLGEYLSTGYFAPRKYAESLDVIPTHLSTQSIILCKIEDVNDLNSILGLINSAEYDKTEYDQFWIGKCEPAIGQNIIIMNRRVGGWDGSKDRPVIELLGAGGHVPCVWNGTTFESMDLKENLKKEFEEELKLDISEEDIAYLGGFHNTFSNELVLLFAMTIKATQISEIQKKTLNNFEENTDGVYMGEFNDVMQQYLENATPFAGGEASKSTNFPSQEMLMKKIREYLE